MIKKCIVVLIAVLFVASGCHRQMEREVDRTVQGEMSVDGQEDGRMGVGVAEADSRLSAAADDQAGNDQTDNGQTGNGRNSGADGQKTSGQGTGADSQNTPDLTEKTVSAHGLPSYTYTGANGHFKAVCEYFCGLAAPELERNVASAKAAGKGTDVVYIPIPNIMKTESAADGQIFLYGTFWDMWYVLEGKNLYCLSGGENTGRLTLKETDAGFSVVEFEPVGDGGDYGEDWRRLCGDDDVLYERLFTKEEREDRRDSIRREMMLWYARDNGLAIESYQNYGWEPKYLEPTYTSEELYFRRDGENYEKARDLTDGVCHWASVVGEGTVVTDSHGHERPIYDTQPRWFENLDSGERISVRRWDNLRASAGDYLIYEYDGTVHVAKKDDLYHPVLSYPVSGTYGVIHKIPDGYMVADDRLCTIKYYNKAFEPVKTMEGYRVEDGMMYYQEGLMAVQDMDTGLIGFLDEKGDFAIPCQYYDAGYFSNGLCPVLTDAAWSPYTEDGGTVKLLGAVGGRWAVIDRDGNYALEPSEAYANVEFDDGGEHNWGARRFSEVRCDRTADFLDISQGDKVVEAVWIR